MAGSGVDVDAELALRGVDASHRHPKPSVRRQVRRRPPKPRYCASRRIAANARLTSLVTHVWSKHASRPPKQYYAEMGPLLGDQTATPFLPRRLKSPAPPRRSTVSPAAVAPARRRANGRADPTPLPNTLPPRLCRPRDRRRDPAAGVHQLVSADIAAVYYRFIIILQPYYHGRDGSVPRPRRSALRGAAWSLTPSRVQVKYRGCWVARPNWAGPDAPTVVRPPLVSDIASSNWCAGAWRLAEAAHEN